MQPTPGDVFVNRPLTTFSTMISADSSAYQADQLAPLTPSDNQDVMWYEFPKSYWFRDGMRLRAPGTRAVMSGYKLTTRTAHLDVWAHAHPIADQTRANMGPNSAPINLDRNATRLLTNMERLNREKSWAATYFAAGVWSTTITGVPAAPGAGQVLQWNDAAATPINDIKAAKRVMKLLTGYIPNTLVMTDDVWDALSENPQILARINGGASARDPAMVTKELVAQLFGVSALIVVGAIENTANEMAPELITAFGSNFTGAFVHPRSALLYYRDASTALDLESAQAMRTMTWRQYIANASGVRIKKFREEPIESDVVEIQSAYKHVVVAPDLGILFSDVAADPLA